MKDKHSGGTVNLQELDHSSETVHCGVRKGGQSILASSSTTVAIAEEEEAVGIVASDHVAIRVGMEERWKSDELAGSQLEADQNEKYDVTKHR